MKTKICNTCKEQKNISEFYYHRQRKIYMNTCKLCNNNKSSDYYSKLKEENIVDYQLRQRASELSRRAKMKNLPYEKKMYKTLKDIFEQQNGLCHYTKIPMENTGFKDNNPYCFVVDRLTPELGYVKDNMVFCCNAINKIKSSFSLDELKWWINQIQ